MVAENSNKTVGRSQASDSAAMENSEWNRLHTLATICTLGGTFLDGYILGLVSGAIPEASAEFDLSAGMQGMIGASALIGIFIGGLLFGRTADRFGRRTVFRWNLVAFVILSLLQLVAVGLWDLTAYRVLLGIAIGVEYAVGAALLAEFIPTRYRSTMLASLSALWFIGFVPATLISLAWSDINWRVILATAAIPALILVVLRTRLPESPKWLISQRRDDEARAILDAHWPSGTALPQPRRAERRHFRELFAKHQLNNTIYSSLFWFCQVAPMFAILTFISPVLNNLGLPEGNTRDLIINLFELLGAVVFIWVLAKSSRRSFAIGTFAVGAVGMLVLGLFPGAPMIVLAMTIALVLGVGAGSNNLQFVYPSEMFPTRIRSSGVGLSAAMSRLGAAVATYLMPALMDSIGVNGAILILAAFPIVGLVASIFMAPETRNIAIE